MKKLLSVLLAFVLVLSLSVPALAAAGFRDVSDNAWYAGDVTYCKNQGLMGGASATTFSPNVAAGRAMLVTVLHRWLDRSTPDALDTPDTPDVPSRPSEPSTGNKTLVVYFSASGSTKSVAGYLADALEADTFELTPVEPYTSADLSWTTPGSRVNREHDNESLRDIALTRTTPANWADYDTVLIGYPIWWGIAAWPVNNFVRSNDFTGKTVIPFCTSASSGLGQSGELIAEMAGTGNWQEGRRFPSGASQSTVESWANTLK